MRVTRRVLALAVAVCLLGTLVGAAPASRAAAERQAAGPYTWRNVEIVGGGFVTGVIFNTAQPDLVYARTDIGGAYRRDTDSGRWVPLLDWVGWDDWNLLGIESLATDPVEPNRVYVAAGTYTNEWSPINGAILRSTDQGQTWQRTNLPFKLGGNEPGRSMGERLVIDPHRNSILYLATRHEGLWKSTDYGATWARVESFPVTGQAGIGLSFVVFDPRGGTPGNPTQTLYVGAADTGTSLYRSTDGGATWSAVPGQSTGFLPHHAVLAFDGVLYITYGSTPGPYDIGQGAVWKLDTASGAWTNISPMPADSSFGYGGLAVDAQHPGTIMVASMNQWWPDDNLYRSTDGGATWTPLWTWGNYPERNLRYTQDVSVSPYLKWGDSAVLPELAPKLGWMIGDLEIDPFDSDAIMYVTGATIYGSDNVTELDSGGTVDITVKAEGLEETSVQVLISPPEGAHLISGLGDIGGFRHDDLTISPPEGMSSNPIFSTTTGADYAERRPSIVVRVGYVWTGAKHGAYSFDGGATWEPFGGEPEGTTGAGSIAVSTNGRNLVWTPNDRPTHYSRDLGTTWTPSAGLPAGVRVIADRFNQRVFYGFDTSTGTLYASTDAGMSFTARATGLPAGQGQLDAVPGREGDLWLSAGVGGLWRSKDGGASFTKVANVEEAHTLGFGKAAPGRDYMAIYLVGKVNGVHGVYRSNNTGRQWVRINDDQHQWGWIGQTITGDPRIYGRVYLGTNGRGILYGDPAH